MHLNLKTWWIGVGALVIIGLIIILVLVIMTPALVPKGISENMLSTIFVPSGEGIVVDKKSMAVTRPKGGEDGVLNFKARIDDVNLIIAEQPTPQQFIDIPKIYDKVIDQSKPYTSFGSTEATVHLTRPKGKQVAMLNTQGTYMLVEAEKDLTESQWRRLFKSLRSTK